MRLKFSRVMLQVMELGVILINITTLYYDSMCAIPFDE
jgi:hypothetical protein